jgi:hypothetical protein
LRGSRAANRSSTTQRGSTSFAAGKDAATLIQGILGGGALDPFKLPIRIGPIP